MKILKHLGNIPIYERVIHRIAGKTRDTLPTILLYFTVNEDYQDSHSSIVYDYYCLSLRISLGIFPIDRDFYSFHYQLDSNGR